jgi:hypothetical protein
MSGAEVAYKFTQHETRSRLTGFEWPTKQWVEIEGAVGLCANGIHACRVEALPRWVDDVLWRVELDGVDVEHEDVLVARRARLLERIEAWNAEAARELARSCATRVREFAAEHPDPLLLRRAEMIAQIADGPDPSATALSMYTTAHALDEVVPGSYWEERRRQADWLRDRLGLV